MRGMFTCGILDLLMEQGVRFDGLVGVSAGAAFGCNYKSGQIGRALRYNQRFGRDSRYMGVRSLLTTGNYINAEFAYHTVPTQYDVFDGEAFERNPMEFHLVCTDTEQGSPVYHKLDKVDYEALEWMRASASMPLVSRPVELDGMKLLDGGIVDSIPLRYFQEQGYKRNIVILTQPKGYFKKRTRLMPIFHLFLRNQPVVTRLMGERHLMYNAQLQYISEQEKLGNALLIYPEESIPISRTCSNPGKLKMVYDMGRKKGEQMLTQITDFLAVS